jgi:hypothetical protein
MRAMCRAKIRIERFFGIEPCDKMRTGGEYNAIIPAHSPDGVLHILSAGIRMRRPSARLYLPLRLASIPRGGADFLGTGVSHGNTIAGGLIQERQRTLVAGHGAR